MRTSVDRWSLGSLRDAPHYSSPELVTQIRGYRQCWGLPLWFSVRSTFSLLPGGILGSARGCYLWSLTTPSQDGCKTGE